MSQLRDRSAPGVRVTLLPGVHAASGEPIDLQGRVISFAFQDAEKKADLATFELDNFDLALFDRPELAGGAILEVSWGYPGHMARPRRIVIKKIKGFQSLTIEGRATSALLDQESKTRVFEHMSASDIAKQLAREHGYEGAFIDIEPTEGALDLINQRRESDARFLRRIAKAAGFEFYIDDGGFHFHERRDQAAPTHTFTYTGDLGRGDILDISVESDLARRAGSITVKGRDPLTKRSVTATVQNTNAQRTTLAEVKEVVDPETGQTTLQTHNATAVTSEAPVTSETEAKSRAQRAYRQAERQSVKLSLRVAGDPTLHAKQLVRVLGISNLLSGTYYATDVKHIISAAGYTCELKLTRDGTGRRAKVLAQEQRGQRNQSPPKARQTPTAVEVVDPETGQTRIEYRQGSAVIGAEDPEAMMSVMR